MKHDDTAGKKQPEQKGRKGIFTPEDFVRISWCQRRACDLLGEGKLPWLECCKLAGEEWEEIHGKEADRSHEA